MKFTYILLLTGSIFIGCKNSSNKEKETRSQTPTLLAKDAINEAKSDSIYNNQEIGFIPKDTINIGSNRAITSLNEYFSKTGSKDSIYILIDEGTYYSNELRITGQHITIEGKGLVNLYCTQLYDNVMWISGKYIEVKNIHMKHFAPGKLEDQNCTGRVIAFDHANHIIIENCDLNGCGLAGLHDNTENSNILIKNNYIHNNSIGAYTDIDGNVWLEETNDHPTFNFENNRMENNGSDRTIEPNRIDDYIIKYPKGYEVDLKASIKHEIEVWKNADNPLTATYKGNYIGDYLHIEFEDNNQKIYDFGFGNNDLGNIELYNNKHFDHNPKYLGKTFKIFWEWKISSFPCCSGEYEIAEAYLPSIVKLEIIEN